MAKAVEEADLEIEGADEADDEPEAAVVYDIAAYPSDLTLSVIAEMWRNGDIVIPSYQRNYVWKIKQASLLIESFLLGLPVPQVFFYVEDTTNKYQVIDGQQRIMTAINYFEGYFGTEVHGRKQVFRLSGLNESSPYANKRYVDLSESDQRRLKGGVLRAINIKQLNPKGNPTAAYHIFERLNTGGTPLKPQEIRNCVYQGQLSASLQVLNRNADWRQLLGRQRLDKHQRDVELLLRLFAISFHRDDYEKPLKEFLNKTMNKEQKGGSADFLDFKARFPVLAAELLLALGPAPFSIRGPLNYAALEAVVCTLFGVKKLPSDLGERYAKLKAEKRFVETTTYSTSDLSVLKQRLKITQEILLGRK